MRDPERIDELVDLFKEFWKKTPDLRFYQVMAIVSSDTGNDPFYIEDDKALENLKSLIKGVRK